VTPKLANSSAAFFMPMIGACQYSTLSFLGRNTVNLNFLLKAKLLANIFFL
jgi:hypothetical protein